MVLIKTTSLANEVQNHFKYISVQVIREGLCHHMIKTVSKNYLKDRQFS